jgi:hypothetical protein
MKALTNHRIKPAGYIVVHRQTRCILAGCRTKLILKRWFLYGFRGGVRRDVEVWPATAELVKSAASRNWPEWHGRTAEVMWRGEMQKVAIEDQANQEDV